MRRATTPTHTFKFPKEVPIDTLDELLLTYTQDRKKILEKTKDDLTFSVDENTVSYVLTQDEANLFAPGKALVQARVKDDNGVVMASQMVEFSVKPVLNSKEL